MAPVKKKAKAADGGNRMENNEVEDSDDDFEVWPPVYANKQSGPGESSKSLCINNREKCKIRKDNAQVFPSLLYRACPNVLVSAIEKMNENQRNEIIEMGFGSILSLTIKFIPTKLGYWILDNFDPKSCEIMLGKDRMLHITSEDVYCVFGLPRGDKLVERKENYKQVESYRRWASHFKSNKYGVKACDILDEMTLVGGEGSSGELFRRNFMVLLNNCLIESNSTGYIKPQIMDCFEDVTSLDKWDWCSYIISRLVYHKSNWAKNKSNAFCGPILFLTALYVDRVEFKGTKVSRAYPTIKYLTFDDIKKRQNDEIEEGCFGHGYPTKPLHVPNQVLHLTSRTLSDVRQVDSDNELKQLAKTFIIMVKNVAKTMTELMDMVEDAPENIIKSNSFLQMLNAAHKLLAFKPEASSSSTNPQQSQFWSSDNDDEFWRQAERAAAIAEIDKAIIRRNDFVKCADHIPSFSLGLTQEFGEVLGDRLRNGNEQNIGDYGKDVQGENVQDLNTFAIVERDADQPYEDHHAGFVSGENDKIQIQELNIETNSHDFEHIVQQDFGNDTDNIDVSLNTISKGKKKVVDDGVSCVQTTVELCAQ